MNRGRKKLNPPRKKLVSIRLDIAVIEHFKRAGGGYQTRINEALKRVARRESEK
jgi:uncharacterized protein (DUF4415 family)